MDDENVIHIKMDYYSAAKKHNIMAFSERQIDLRNITNSEKKTLLFTLICGPSLQCVNAYM